jgi:D-beta-D-heptose 7-phosphate kinase/D-beta-D-heptose 1-phosphate adenosyltransferase
MSADLTNLVQSFQGRRVMVVGDLILDRYLYGDAERISPEAPVPVLRAVESREAVGGSGNVAACLTALGCQAVSVGVVGDDAHGATLRRLLLETGVDASGIAALPDRRTTTKTRLVGLAQHRHRQQLLRLDEEDSTPLAESVTDRLMQAVRERVAGVDAVCLEDYDKGVVTEGLAQAVVAAAQGARKPVLADPARLSDYGRYTGVDLVTPNRDELSVAVGRRLETMPEIAVAACRLREAFRIGAVVVTLDREGALLVRSGTAWRHFPTVPRSVYDNTGAGDAVLAMLAACLAAGGDPESAVQLANIAGGLEVERFGCVPITADEVLAELRLADRLRNGKLRSVEELVAELNIRRDRGETVAFTNGCFDILHAGHVEFLRRCRKEASTLVVGLNTDASVGGLGKGSHRPVQPFEDRAAVLGALEFVDYVVGFDEPDPEALIRRIRPDVLIKGEDWANKGIKGREFVESLGGRVVLLPLLEGRSTTSIIERIRRGP